MSKPRLSLPNAPTADSYEGLEPREHAYRRPNTYIGSVNIVEVPRQVYNFVTGVVEYKNVHYSNAIERLLLEALSNVTDNCLRYKDDGGDPGHVEMFVNHKTISVKNGGYPIPIELKEISQNGQRVQMYVPSIIFGTMFSGSNLDDGNERKGAGVNGIGAKAVNIFSKTFMVVVEDPIRHVKFTQVWYNNMKDPQHPILEAYNGHAASVQVVYEMDFERLGLQVPTVADITPEEIDYLTPVPPNEDGSPRLNEDGTPVVKTPPPYAGGYTLDMIQLFAMHALNSSYTAKVPVIFNGIPLDFYSWKMYAKLFYGDNIPPHVVYYQWPPGTETIGKGTTAVARNPRAVPLVELIVFDTPDRQFNSTFANCLMTQNGGVHLEAAIQAVGRKVVDTINEKNNPKGKDKGKGKDKVAEIPRPKLTIADVKPHLSVLMSVRVINPEYNSQSKDVLSGPQVKLTMDEETQAAVLKWSLYERLMATVEAKDYAAIVKADGKVRHKYVFTKKGQDANHAGKAGWRDTGLYLTEGDSAANYVVYMMSFLGRDKIGYCPLKGKGLNVTNASFRSIMGNAEIANIKKLLGLREGLDYTQEENFKTLRYGFVMFLADADVDGKHIIGLLLNLFHRQYPSLLARNYVMFYRTPIIRITGFGQKLSFYTLTEYNQWLQHVNGNTKGWDINYYKGLGTSTKEEVGENCMNPRVVTCFYDDQAPAALQLAFDKKFSNQRKQWMAQWQQSFDVESMAVQPISMFIHHEFIQYSIANVHRSIPSIIDGLKPGQRKILWGVMAHFGLIKLKKDGSVVLEKTKDLEVSDNTEDVEDDDDDSVTDVFKRKPIRQKTYKKEKVAQLSCSVASKTQYHHGTASLSAAITGMAQDFIGSNNLPYLMRDGSFGTRNEGGKDAASDRYIFSRPEWWIPYVFRKEDIQVLTQLEDEGFKIEPKYLLPILPLILINGSRGIGTGHSSNCANHNPLDLIAWYKAKLTGAPLPPVLPWYRDFKGDLVLVERKTKNPANNTPAVISVANLTTGVTQNVESEEALNDVTGAPGEMAPVEAVVIENKEIEEEAEEDEVEEKVKEVVVETNQPPPKMSLVTKGHLRNMGGGKWVISELPIGKWMKPYREELELLLAEKKIKDMVDNSTDDTASYEISGVTFTPTMKNMKLSTTITMSNMVFLDIDNKPRLYESVSEILEYFYQVRLTYYEHRKILTLNTIATEITELNHKIRFIQAVLDGRLVVQRRKRADVEADMVRLGLPVELVRNTRTSNFLEEELHKLMKTVEQKYKAHQYFQGIDVKVLWMEDLVEFENAYIQYYNNRAAPTTVAAAKGTKATGKGRKRR